MRIITLVLMCLLVSGVVCRAEGGAIGQYLDNYNQSQSKIDDLLENYGSSSSYSDLTNKMEAIKNDFNKANTGIVLDDMDQLDVDINEYMNKLINLFKDYEDNQTKNDALLQEAKGLKAKVQDDIGNLSGGY